MLNGTMRRATKELGQMRNTRGTAATWTRNLLKSTPTDNDHKPTYEDANKLTQALQGLHMSQILGIDDDGEDEEGANDIDISKNERVGEER